MSGTVGADRWDSGNDYDRFMGHWSRLVAVDFLRWLAVPAGAAWLDVGTGTGALLHAIASTASPRHVAGVDRSEAFLAVAGQGPGSGADLRIGDATDLPFDPDPFDVVVSGLVLNFLPDPDAALAAMRRVCRPGGTVAAYVWDYADGMQFLRRFWDAATLLDPDAIELDEGRRRFPLCHPGPLAALFTDAGLADVETSAIDVARSFPAFDNYWQPFLAGQGPAGTYLVGLPPERQAALAAEVRVRLPTSVDGSIRLSARAWAVRGGN